MTEVAAWRLLKTLQARGLVTADAAGRYSLGPTTIGLGQVAGPDALVAAARPALERVAHLTGETAAVAMPGAAGLTYVDEVAPVSVLAAGWLGRSVAVHATSTGKALLAFRPAAEAREALRGPLPAFTGTTITDPDALAAELAATRARGYGTCAGELEPALYGVSAPVLDPAGWAMAVISIWGPRDRVPEERFAVLGPIAAAAAREVSSARIATNGTFAR